MGIPSDQIGQRRLLRSLFNLRMPGVIGEDFLKLQDEYLQTELKEKGIDGLADRRGRGKPKDELSDIEKLKAENRILKAEKKRQQMEIDLLKKLENIERR